MKIFIDNLDGSGPRDYSVFLESGPRVHRFLNRAAEIEATLVGTTPEFVVPVAGARVQLVKRDGGKVFTGYLFDPPAYEYLGWGMAGPTYRYKLVAPSDECLLDRKAIPVRAPMAGRTAGAAIRILTEELLPGKFDLTGVDDVVPLPFFEVHPGKSWSLHAAEIALRARATYRVHDGAVIFEAIPTAVHDLREKSHGLSAADLKLQRQCRILNDLTILGDPEPQAYVKDYFCGDGMSMRFDLSQVPFTRPSRMLLDEEFKGTSLDPLHWTLRGNSTGISVGSGKLHIECTGADGSTVLQFADNIEVGGALIFQHGQLSFTGPSDGIIGGLYNGTVSALSCMAGFRVTPNAGQSAIQAVIGGLPVGPVVGSTAGHQYGLTTRVYASEIYRSKELFHSSVHVAGNGRGGDIIAADTRIVLELHDFDPANPSSVASLPIVLYDGLLTNVPGCCAYALIDGGSLHCDVTFTRISRPVDAEVRSAAPGQGYRTRLPGALSEGAECSISESPAVQFFSGSVPVSDEKIIVSYRARGRSVAHINDPDSINRSRTDADNGVFGAVCEVVSPAARTSADCTNAALALLDDSVRESWAGEYRIWNDFLAPGEDVHPGDAINVSAPSRNAEFRAIVREVHIEVHDLRNDRMEYRIRFADDQAEPLALACRSISSLTVPSTTSLPTTQLEAGMPPLAAAEVTEIASTTVTIDTGVSLPRGGGIEVRRSDAGFGTENDRNLIGRFGTRVITLPRLSRVQTYFLRQYDASLPPLYSEFSTAIFVDYPL